MRCQVVACILSATALTRATQVANFNVSESVAAQYGCNSTCYAKFSDGLKKDAAEFGSVYDVDFYDTSVNFTNAQPGDLLKLKAINSSDWDPLSSIPKGITAYRFQYVSEDLSGSKVPATGFIAFPYAGRKRGKFGTIAYAHGTSGVFKGCAPSAMTDLYEYDSWRSLTERGYAVIATDYAGLGNNYTAHQYEASPAQANDLYYSVAAAHKAFANSLTKEWMSVGHSQGGAATWLLSESALLKSNPLCLGKYLGTVAHAPGVRVKDQALTAVGGDDSDSSSDGSLYGEFANIVLGLRAILPNDTQSWVPDKFRKRLALASLAQACYYSLDALTADLQLEDVADISNPDLFTAFDVLQNLTSPGRSQSYKPVLVTQGLADQSVVPQVTETAWNASCSAGSEVHLRLYPKISHDSIIVTSAPFVLQWIDDRFAGKRTSGRCSNETVAAFDQANVFTGPPT